jgi:hypothetical protein
MGQEGHPSGGEYSAPFGAIECPIIGVSLARRTPVPIQLAQQMAKEKAAERQAELDHDWLSQVRASLAESAARLDLMRLVRASGNPEDGRARWLGRILALVRSAIAEIDVGAEEASP